MEITVDIFTDNYPAETSWTLTNCDGIVEESVSENQRYTAVTTQYSDTYCVPKAGYIFTVFDEYKDGICCGTYGDGNYKVTSNGEVVASGGDFGDKENTSFGSCAPLPTVSIVYSFFMLEESYFN